MERPAMFLRETVEPCPVCREVTPHSERRVAVPKLLAIACLAGVALGAAVGGAGMLLAVVLALAAPLLWLRDRERLWHVRCVRCRTKQRVELERTKPKLGSTTIIDPL